MRSTSSAPKPLDPAPARAWLQGGTLLAVTAVALRASGAWDYEPVLGRLPGLCLFHQLTGLDCPGCGMTRAFLCLLRGDLHGAWHWHPFSLPLALTLLAMAWAPQAWLERAQRWPFMRALSIACLLVLLGWWGWVKLWPHG